jgi:hypothetical protein
MNLLPRDCRPTGSHPKVRCSKGYRPTGFLPKDYHPKGYRPRDCPPKDCLPMGYRPTVCPNPAGCQKRLGQVVLMPANWCQAELLRSSRTFS